MPALLVNADEPNVYKISEKRIEISENIAKLQGQVMRAFVKAWLLQRAKPEINDSLLRTSVVSGRVEFNIAQRRAIQCSDP